MAVVAFGDVEGMGGSSGFSGAGEEHF